MGAVTKVSFFNSALGHAVVGIAVTAVVSILSALVNDPTFSSTVLGGGVTVTIAKFVLDTLNKSIPTLP